jgi:hypothetical protein
MAICGRQDRAISLSKLCCRTEFKARRFAEPLDKGDSRPNRPALFLRARFAYDFGQIVE